ncbi:MAG TPA: hypothetical protein VFU55_02290 [Terracidiphilus sp.]|nr:hypothetical protein [Terracidiphilus sp.]
MDASIPASSLFHRRQNGDGSHTSRCLHCFLVIAQNAESPEALDRLERRHICPEKALAQLRAGGLIPLSGERSGKASA